MCALQWFEWAHFINADHIVSELLQTDERSSAVLRPHDGEFVYHGYDCGLVH
jgi:hypothetical protein